MHSIYTMGKIGIEIRGNSTQRFPKKSYTVELWSTANTPIESELLGMAAESEWVLNAMHIDKTLMRIPMSFYLAQQNLGIMQATGDMQK